MQLPIFTLLVFGLLSSAESTSISKPWDPEPVLNNTYWDWRHNVNLMMIENNTKSNKIQVIFIGDSITDMWIYDKHGKPIWTKEYAPLGAVNLGIGGDRTQNILWRIDNEKLEMLTSPPLKLVVLCIGTNNIGINNATDEEIVKGVDTIVKRLRVILPQTKILLLGLFPRQTLWHFIRVANINLKMARIDSVNYGKVPATDGNGTSTDVSNSTTESKPGAENGGESGDKMIRFLDMWTHFAEGFGKVVPELFATDQVHLNTDGYAKWAQVMNSTFTEMLTG